MAPSSESQDDVFQPTDAISSSMRSAAVFGVAGLFGAAIANARRKTNLGALGVLTRGGRQIVAMSFAGGAFGFTSSAAANLRGKNDLWNETIAGFPAGAIIGVQKGRLAPVIGMGAFASVLMFTVNICGGTIHGWVNESDDEAWERKMKARANRRRPLEETIAEVGEGRGIQPPGYEERRRQRLKEKYGIEVNPVKATVD